MWELRFDRRAKRRLAVLFGVIAAAAVLIAVFVTSGARNDAERKRTRGIYSRGEFEKLVVGKGKTEIINLIGRPMKVYDGGRYTEWTYYWRTRHPEAARPDPSVIIQFDKLERCVSVIH